MVAVIFLVNIFFPFSSVLAQDAYGYYGRNDPPEVISETATNLEAGTDFDNAPLK